VAEHEIPLTADMFMYKRTVGQLLAIMSVSEEQVSRGGWRFGYGRRMKEYPDRFSLLYDYCYYAGFIREETASLQLTDSGSAHLKADKADSPIDLYRFWLRLYKTPIPALQSLVHWIRVLAPSWVSLHSLQDTLVPLIRPFYYDTPQSIFDARIIHMLAHLGLVAIGDDPIQGRSVRITRLGDTVIGGEAHTDAKPILLHSD